MTRRRPGNFLEGECARAPCVNDVGIFWGKFCSGYDARLKFSKLTHFQNFAWFSNFCPIFKILPNFQNFAPFSKFCSVTGSKPGAVSTCCSIPCLGGWKAGKFWKSDKILKIGQKFENRAKIWKWVNFENFKRASFPEQNFPQKIRASFTHGARARSPSKNFRDVRASFTNDARAKSARWYARFTRGLSY